VESLGQCAADATGGAGNENRVAGHLHGCCLSVEVKATAIQENPGGEQSGATATSRRK
jgi:hypothetical protein